jgi:hypothetical protein
LIEFGSFDLKFLLQSKQNAAPVSFEYDPGMQGKQKADPDFFCENPAGQFKHVSISPYAPTLSENVPTTQLTQEILEEDPSSVEPCLPAL